MSFAIGVVLGVVLCHLNHKYKVHNIIKAKINSLLP
jgi:hypothetical protein|nr:hypothetical protein [uncultured Mediterranean phage uvMED]